MINGRLKGGGGEGHANHIEVHPQKKKEVLYLVKKKTWEKLKSRAISSQNQSRTLNAVI